MNIFKKNPEDEKYVGAMRRGLAVTIDVWIVLVLRIIFMEFLGRVWMNQQLINFFQEFQEKFGTETIKDVPEHIDFIIHHPIFIQSLIFYFLVVMIGAIYHAYLNSSNWNGTIGKRIMKIMIITENSLKISFKRGILHYFLSVLPFAYLIYLTSYQVRHDVGFYQALTASDLNVLLGLIFVLWVQIHLFTKKRTTAYDLICHTVIVNGKTPYKWPWSK